MKANRLLLAFLGASLFSPVAALSAAGEKMTVELNEMQQIVPREFTGDLRELPPMPPAAMQPDEHPLLPMPKTERKPLPGAATMAAPAAAALTLGPMPGPILNFAGMSKFDDCGGVDCGSGWPPDTNGMAGDYHYIQAVNSSFAIYSKAGALLASFTENQLWAGAGTPCDGDSRGDPVVVYDPFAMRWIITNFAFARVAGIPVTPFYQCIAVSKTSDPVAGGWWLYPIQADDGVVVPTGYLNDYPKFGIWPDCLYMAANEFTFSPTTYQGVMVAAFNRADLESGAPLTYTLGFLPWPALDVFTLVPSNASSRWAGSAPLAGTPNYFVSESTTFFTFNVWEFAADPDCGGGVFSGPTYVTQQTYDWDLENVPQPNTANTLDTVGDGLMQKVQYRRTGAAESLWVVHNVQDALDPTGTVRPQWAELDVSGGVIATTPVQQQIYAPDTTLNRWMGSIATDHNGNAALGYSTSNGTAPNFPSISYAGRLATDPLNELPRGENQLIAGGGSQTNICGLAPCQRWGDYSEMSIDPADDCTFWYTTEYYDTQANGTAGNWHTRIGSFRFPECVSPGVAPVPTLGQAGLVAGLVLLAGFGIAGIRRRR